MTPQANNDTIMADEKVDSVLAQLEDVGQIEHRDAFGRLVMPAELSALSEAEYNALGKRATWKMDIVIMPCVVIMYILNYLDRQNIASAKLADITTDLGLSAVQYQTSVSILFASYSEFLSAPSSLCKTDSCPVLMQVPSNMIAGKVKYPAVYICLAMSLWGVVSALMAAVQGFGGLIACRLALGVVEAAFFPGALYFLSLFYNRKQFALRTAILYSGSQLGNAFGGLFAILVLKLDGVHGIEGWRWVSGFEKFFSSALTCCSSSSLKVSLPSV